MSIHRALTALLGAAVAAATIALAASHVDERPGELQGLSTASYGLFPVDDSGVTGQLQIVSRMNGGSVLILTVHGIDDDRTYPAALYIGSCGPDRPLLLELEAVGRANDPFVSITETQIPFADLTEGEYFVYVFDGPTIDRPEREGLDVPALACGEVGRGANEEQP
jgi:hypothetical protein